MTAEEAAVLAMARTSEITDHYPATRSLMYRRTGLRQRELMSMAGRKNPDYYGVCAVTTLDELTATDLNDIIEPVPTPELIEVITIEDAGSSEWETGQIVSIVPRADVDCELPPRATLRDLVFQGVGTDLAGVVSIEVFYTRLAPELGPFDGDSTLELQHPHNELIVIDLTRHLLRKAARLPDNIRNAAIAMLTEEEAPLLDAYFAHVVQYAPRTTRFSRTIPR